VNRYPELRFLERANWDAFDPVLISECLFSTANIFSTLRLVQIFTVNPHLGPLQISLGRMLNDILKFFCVYLLVLIAFACGMNQLFWFFAQERGKNCAHTGLRHWHPKVNDTDNKDIYEYCVTRGKYFTK
ncbi:unnamed protein product, partial [Protopolystoma xenopodis]